MDKYEFTVVFDDDVSVSFTIQVDLERAEIILDQLISVPGVWAAFHEVSHE